MDKFSVLVIFALACVATHSSPELKGSPNELKAFLYPSKNTVTIKGSVEKKAYSDKAIVNLLVLTEEDKLSGAVAKNSSVRKLIREALVESGVKHDDINTSKFSTSPQYGWFGDDPDSFKVANRIAVNIYSEQQLNAIAKITDSKKEVSLSSMDFEHTSKDEFEQNVKKEALDKVMQQKSFYETTLGLALKPVAFRDFDVVQTGSKGAKDYSERIVITGSRIKRRGDADINPILNRKQTFDEVEYTATIAVDFEVVSKN
jgi:hypothetical protein